MANPSNTAESLSQRILQGIPLANAMNFSIKVLDQHSIQVAAPLDDNANVHGTGFAGSLYSAAALAAWGLTTHIIEQAGIDADVVMAKAEIRYKKPIQSDILCTCHCEAETRDVFLKHLNSRGRGRLSLLVDIGEASEAILSATMVAIIK